MRSVLRRQDSVAELGAAVMQQADVAALWLLEALVVTLPQSLLQAFVVMSTDVGIASPGLNNRLRSLCGVSPIHDISYLTCYTIFLFTFSGLLLRPVCAVYLLGPGALQPSLLSDTAGPPGYAARGLAVPAGVEGGHARSESDLPHVFCPGLQLVGVRSGR